MPWTEAEPGAGEPDGVLVLAGELERDADDAGQAARTLRSIQSQTGDAVWRGSSADAFRGRIDKLPGHLEKLQASYAEAAAGLRGYAAAVRQIAGEATVQQRLIAQSEAELGQAQTQQASWVAPPDPVTGHPDPSARNPHDAAVDAAQASVRRAQARLAGLAVQRRAADRRVVDTLHRAHGAGMQNKHWWQKVLNFASEALAKVTIVLMVVALVAIVVLAIVQPELIPGLLLLAGQLLTGLSAAQLAVDGARKATGEDVSWGSLAMDALGAVPFAGKLAAGLPLVSKGVDALRGAAGAVRGLGTAGSAFLHSLGSDLKATRFVIRMADTGTGVMMMSVGKEGKTAGEMLSSAREEWQAASKVERQPMQPPPKIHPGKQGKHIRGHNNFDEGRSELTADPHELVKAAGTGDQMGKIPRGQPNFKERVEYDRIIGIYGSPAEGIRIPTTRAMIIYAGDGTVHIVPVRPAT